jgi:hypothetical protein
MLSMGESEIHVKVVVLERPPNNPLMASCYWKMEEGRRKLGTEC